MSASAALNFSKNLVGLVEGEFVRSGVQAVHSSERDGAGCIAFHQHNSAESGDGDECWRHRNARAKDQGAGLQQRLLELRSQLGAISKYKQPRGLHD